LKVRLTSGGGLARIDVADNDHVDVHLFLTVGMRRVSRYSIKIAIIVAMMLLMEERMEMAVDSPHGCGLGFFSVCVCFLVSGWKRLKSEEDDGQ